MTKLYTYSIETKCKSFNDGEKMIRTYEKMHDGRTKDKSKLIACAKHTPPHDIILRLVEVTEK